MANTMTISRLPQLRNDAPIILGAGALLDVLGTGCAHAVLRAVKRRPIVETGVATQLPNGSTGKEGLEELLAAGVIRMEPLPAGSSVIFLSLAGAVPPDDLSDEEAACIALASSLHGAVVLNDAKPQHVAEAILPGCVLHSLDLLAAPEARESLGLPAIAQAIARAQDVVRLRVPPRFRNWTVSLKDSHLLSAKAV